MMATSETDANDVVDPHLVAAVQQLGRQIELLGQNLNELRDRLALSGDQGRGEGAEPTS
jgi:hypothetical protein